MYANVSIKIKDQAMKAVIPAAQKWLEAMALWFERTAKITTTNERHVVTGRYRASINLNDMDWMPHDTVPETQAWDGVHEFVEDLKLHTGTNVEYAKYLEKKYWILARSLDMSKWQMVNLFNTSFRNNYKQWLQ